MQVDSEIREIPCVLLAEFQMKIHFNFEVWSKENSTGAASVIGLQTRAETGNFGGEFVCIFGKSWIAHYGQTEQIQFLYKQILFGSRYSP